MALISGFMFLFVNTNMQSIKEYVDFTCSIIKFDYPMQILDDNCRVVIKQLKKIIIFKILESTMIIIL